MPEAIADSGWSAVLSSDSLDVSWAASEGAEWYEVRLEGGGPSVEGTLVDPNVLLNNLVPGTRYLFEVARGARRACALGVNRAGDQLQALSDARITCRERPGLGCL